VYTELGLYMKSFCQHPWKQAPKAKLITFEIYSTGRSHHGCIIFVCVCDADGVRCCNYIFQQQIKRRVIKLLQRCRASPHLC